MVDQLAKKRKGFSPKNKFLVDIGLEGSWKDSQTSKRKNEKKHSAKYTNKVLISKFFQELTENGNWILNDSTLGMLMNLGWRIFPVNSGW